MTAALARAIAPAWGVSPESAQNTLCAWLKGRRAKIPQAAIEAMLCQLDLVIVPRTPGDGSLVHLTITTPESWKEPLPD